MKKSFDERRSNTAWTSGVWSLPSSDHLVVAGALSMEYSKCTTWQNAMTNWWSGTGKVRKLVCMYSHFYSRWKSQCCVPNECHWSIANRCMHDRLCLGHIGIHNSQKIVIMHTWRCGILQALQRLLALLDQWGWLRHWIAASFPWGWLCLNSVGSAGLHKGCLYSDHISAHLPPMTEKLHMQESINEKI